MKLVGYSRQEGRCDGVQIMLADGYAYAGHIFSKGFAVAGWLGGRSGVVHPFYADRMIPTRRSMVWRKVPAGTPTCRSSDHPTTRRRRLR